MRLLTLLLIGLAASVLAQPGTFRDLARDFVKLNSTNWQYVNHDLHMTRSSPQTFIGRDNVASLRVMWVWDNCEGEPVENSPLIIGDTGYSIDNHMRIRAFRLMDGSTRWRFTPKIPEVDNSAHGMAYHDGVLYAPTGGRGTVVALDAENGELIWETERLAERTGFTVGAPPVVWEDYIVMGASLGDEPPLRPAIRGNIFALNRTTGRRIWTTPTAIGAWIEGVNGSINAGAASWSGGALDEETGIVYMPIGNAAPDFNATFRPSTQLYANHIIAINVTTGHIIWATPFLAEGTVLRVNASIPDVHDYDVAWGSILTSFDFEDGQGKRKIVIGHDKIGDIIAMDAATGVPIWWTTVGTVKNANEIPTPNGTDPIWVGTQNGIEAYAAVDNETLYVAVSSGAYRFYVNGTGGYLVPAFDEPGMENGIGNGSIIAIYLKNGTIKWEHPTPTPTWVSPLVTNGVVFSGYITPPGQPYQAGQFGEPLAPTPNVVEGIILALDSSTGTDSAPGFSLTSSGARLWDYNVGVPVGIGGPSIGNGVLLVPTGSEDEVPANDFGRIVAFGLPACDSVKVFNETEGKTANLTLGEAEIGENAAIGRPANP